MVPGCGSPACRPESLTRESRQLGSALRVLTPELQNTRKITWSLGAGQDNSLVMGGIVGGRRQLGGFTSSNGIDFIRAFQRSRCVAMAASPTSARAPAPPPSSLSQVAQPTSCALL